jgi:glutathione S-transferase
MILIGQYDSPFVRRVAIALHLYDHPFEHRPWSSVGDAEALAEFNPLRRVPTLILDDQTVLIDSVTMLDYLDEVAAPGTRLIPAAGPSRRSALKRCALATGMCDKMVSLVFERALHATISETWVARCQAQICGVLDVLEADRARHEAPFWWGDSPGHADIAVACAMRFLNEAHPTIHTAGDWPALKAHAATCEALDVFRAVTQPFRPPPV